jgi:hypothetical protein
VVEGERITMVVTRYSLNGSHDLELWKQVVIV